MSREFLKSLSPLLMFSRMHRRQHTPIHKRFKAPGGVKYPGGITYYPRFPDEKDPDITPSKLFRVERIKPVKGTPRWNRKILKELHLDENEKVAIVKNIPNINARLWQIKHLIKVTPIVFPYGEPTEEDLNHTILRENGECIVTKKIAVDPKVLEASDQFATDPKRMDSDTLKKDSRRKWDIPWNGGF